MAYNEKCSPLNNKINVPQLSPIPPIPGFGIDVNPKFPQLPSITGIPEDILKYVDMLKLALPGGAFLKDFIKDLKESVTKIISSLLGYINIFISMYYIILAIIELILCIINVLCGLPSPFSMYRRVKKLKRKCIPIFIKTCFPIFVFLALLLALIAILLALIEYIIALIKRVIEQLLRNVSRLKFLLQQGNSDAALAAISKIGDLLCLFEHVFVLLGAVDTIMELIKTKWKKILKVCKSGGGRGGGDDGDDCCDSICANFLSEPIAQIDNPMELWDSRVRGSTGELLYTNPVLGSPYPIFPSMIIPIRNEAVYLQDNNLDSLLSFNNIIASEGIDGMMFPFFPSTTITKNTPAKQIPYYVDVNLWWDPSDGYGFRLIKVEYCAVSTVVYDAPLNIVAGATVNVNNPKAYLILDGGSYYDRLGRYYSITDIMKAKSGLDASADGNGSYYSQSNITYQLRINYDALLSYNLITIDCVPTMKLEDEHLSATMYRPLHLSLGGTGGPNGIGGPDGTDDTDTTIPDGGIVYRDGSIGPGQGIPPRDRFDKIPAPEELTPEEAAQKAAIGTIGGVNSLGVLDITLPDVAGILQQLENTLNSYRNNITEETTIELESVLTGLLQRLQGQANTTYSQLLTASVDAYSTTKTLEPEVQFISDKIIVTVTPTSLDGLPLQNLVGNFGTNTQINSTLASKFTAKPSLGFITGFTYDGYGNFTAELTTDVAGDGYIDLYFDNQLIPTINSPESLSEAPSISLAPLPYSFIGFVESGFGTGGLDHQGELPGIRRDETDISNSRN